MHVTVYSTSDLSTKKLLRVKTCLSLSCAITVELNYIHRDWRDSNLLSSNQFSLLFEMFYAACN